MRSVGTNVMNPYSDNGGVVVLSYIIGFACIFVGTVEILFGAKCAPAQTGPSDSEAEVPPASNAPVRTDAQEALPAPT